MNEFLRAVARVCGVHVSLHRMWCSAWAVVSCGVLVAWLFVAGALRWLLHERLSASQPSRAATSEPPHPTLFRPPGRPCRKESQTFGLIPYQILWIASAVGCQSTHARLRSSCRGGHPALAPTSAPGARDHCRATGPRVCKSSLTWIHRGQPALVSTKSVLKLDHQGTTSPTGIQISPLVTKKNWTTLQGMHCIT